MIAIKMYSPLAISHWFELFQRLRPLEYIFSDVTTTRREAKIIRRFGDVPLRQFQRRSPQLCSQGNYLFKSSHTARRDLVAERLGSVSGSHSHQESQSTLRCNVDNHARSMLSE